jgi:hypothetical protein
LRSFKLNVIIGFLALNFSSKAATDSSKQLKFISVQQIGLIKTLYDLTLELNLSAGVARKKWDYMLGVTLVQSNIKHYAFYGDIRFHPTKSRNFYLGLNSGTTVMSSKQPWAYPFGMIYTEERAIKKMLGLTESAIIGYKAKLGKEVFYNFNFIYNYSTVRYKETYLITGERNVTGSFTYLQTKFGFRAGLSF